MHTTMAPLWQLCKEGKLAKVREALARGEDVNCKDEGNWTAIMLAIKYNVGTKIVKLLLEQPFVDLNCTNKYGQTALHIAAMMNSVEATKMLLAATVNLNGTDKFGQTALHKAARGDNVEIVKMLLADPRLTTHNHKDNRGWTAVMSAAYYKNAGALRELVAHPSVNLDTKDEHGRSLEEFARWT